MLRLWWAAPLGLLSSVLLGGCYADDTPSNELPDATAMAETAPPMDAASDAPAARAKVVAVHASPNSPKIRWCFAVGTKADGTDAVLAAVPPFPEAGLDRGQGFVVPDFGDLSGVVVPYLVNASKAPAKCSDILGDAGLIPGGDYHKVAPIPAGTIAGAKTVLVSAMGCLGTSFDPTANAQRCGADFNPLLGNLSVRVFDLDRMTQQGQLGAQLAHLSPPLGSVVAGLTSMPDASPVFFVPIASNVKFGEVKPTPATALVVPNLSTTLIQIGVLEPDGGPNPSALYTFPLPEDAGIQNGANTTFVLLGEPASDAGNALRVIALPNDPVVPKYP